MNAAVATAIALVIYVAGYLLYGRYLGATVFELDDDNITPAHSQTDGVDYVPTSSPVLFGHHYASIAGLAPMLGPAVAVIWGWLPAMAWVVMGALLVGCVHDLGSLVVSIRARGKSVGAVAEGVIGPRAKSLLHIIIFFLVALAMGVFVYVIAFLFSPAPDPSQADFRFPQAVVPSFGLMVVASIIGWLGYRRNFSWQLMTPIGFVILVALVYIAQLDPVLAATGLADPSFAPGRSTWSGLLLVYALVASVLPVWLLLQPRDFLNVLLLFLGLGSVYVGIFVGQPEFVAPAVNTSPEGAPSMFPFVFIVIACGAASGFHSLVSSGTTAKQLDRETDALPIGYGGMIGESMLGLLAVIATTAGLASADAWHAQYASWEAVSALGVKVSVFINGAASFLTSLGMPKPLGASFVAVIVVSYALTSLDSATRLLRYNIEEVGETLETNISGLTINPFGHRYVSGILAAGAIGFFAFYEVEKPGEPGEYQSAGLALWELFGTTNQLMAGLALLVVTMYLAMRDKPWWVTGIPMAAMVGTTLTAMVSKIQTFWSNGHVLLLSIGSLLFILGVWLVVEATIAIYRFHEQGHTVKSLMVDLDGSDRFAD